MGNTATSELFAFFSSPRRVIWTLGLSSWLFGITDRSFAALADGSLSATDFVQLFIASFFAFSWVLLKPSRK